MSTYVLEDSVVGAIKVTKKRGMRTLRMRLSPKGEVLVSVPWSVPRPFVSQFVKDRREWIQSNTKNDHHIPLQNGMVVGANTKLYISDGASRNFAKMDSTGLRIKLAGRFNPTDKTQQSYIEKKALEAMITEAENELLPRLEAMAASTGHVFNQAYIKRLSSRWGSCDQDKNIILNVFLLQLPSKLQDYVMLHELTHTVYLNHSPAFWDHMEKHMPSVRLYKKLTRQYRPRIEPRI